MTAHPDQPARVTRRRRYAPPQQIAQNSVRGAVTNLLVGMTGPGHVRDEQVQAWLDAPVPGHAVTPRVLLDDPPALDDARVQAMLADLVSWRARELPDAGPADGGPFTP